MKVYSPSATTTFAQCPMKWWLRRRGIGPRVLTKATLAAELGTLISRGMEHHHRLELAQGCPDEEYMAQLVAESEVLGNKSRLIVPGNLEVEFGLVVSRAKRAIEALAKAAPLVKGAWTIDAEMVLERHGKARIDLLLGTEGGSIVVDYKSKVQVTAYYREQTKEDYTYSWQMYHYVWALRQLGYRVSEFMIALVVIEPKAKVYKWLYSVDEDYLKRWETAALYYWAQMEAIEQGLAVGVPMAPEHRTKFGMCEMADHCLTGGGAHDEPDGQIFLVKEKA